MKAGRKSRLAFFMRSDNQIIDGIYKLCYNINIVCGANGRVAFLSSKASKNLNRTLSLGSFSLFFSAFIIAYNVVKPPISACSRLY